MTDVSIHLICSHRAGTLSRLIRHIKSFGLTYKQHKIEDQGENNLITVCGSGELNCTRDALLNTFNNITEVISVKDIFISDDDIERPDCTTQNEKMSPEAALTPAILLVAEQRLAEVLGPVANYLVTITAERSKNTGELFRSLAKELNTDAERRAFVSIVGKRTPQTGNTP